ncbi:hypothetical protein SMJ63A_110042 [Stenotrophomonas geniculata]
MIAENRSQPRKTRLFFRLSWTCDAGFAAATLPPRHGADPTLGTGRLPARPERHRLRPAGG